MSDRALRTEDVTASKRGRRGERVDLASLVGQRFGLKDWAAELGIKYSTLHSRVTRHGWSEERALSTPVGSP